MDANAKYCANPCRMEGDVVRSIRGLPGPGGPSGTATGRWLSSQFPRSRSRGWIQAGNSAVAGTLFLAGAAGLARVTTRPITTDDAPSRPPTPPPIRPLSRRPLQERIQRRPVLGASSANTNEPLNPRSGLVTRFWNHPGVAWFECRRARRGRPRTRTRDRSPRCPRKTPDGAGADRTRRRIGTSDVQRTDPA